MYSIYIYIYTYIWLILMLNAGIPIQYMDSLGYGYFVYPLFWRARRCLLDRHDQNGNGVAFVLVVFSRMALATETTSNEAGRFIS